MNVAAYIAQFLAEQGVGHVFGYQGGAILKIVDEVLKIWGGRHLYRTITNRHLPFAAMPMPGLAAVSGLQLRPRPWSNQSNHRHRKCPVRIDSDAVSDGTGLSSNIYTKSGVRQNGFQDLDIVSVVRPITKYASLITDELDIRRELEKAAWCARSGRPGAVLLDIPIDIQFKEIDTDKCSTASLLHRALTTRRRICFLGRPHPICATTRDPHRRGCTFERGDYRTTGFRSSEPHTSLVHLERFGCHRGQLGICGSSWQSRREPRCPERGPSARSRGALRPTSDQQDFRKTTRLHLLFTWTSISNELGRIFNEGVAQSRSKDVPGDRRRRIAR